MGSRFFLHTCLCLLTLLVVKGNSKDCSNTYSSYYRSNGDVVITGLFNAHKGVNCTEPVSVGLQQMTNLATVLHILNGVQYVPEVTIGTVLYDLCSIKESAPKALVSSLLNRDCQRSNNLGIITTTDISEEIKNLSESLNVSIFNLLPSTNTDLYFKIAIHLLIELHSTIIDAVAMPSSTLLNRFSKFATEEGICLKQLFHTSDLNTLCFGEDSVVILGITSMDVDMLFKIDSDCASRFIIMLFDTEMDFIKLSNNLLLNDTYLIIPSNLWIEPIVPMEKDFTASLKIIEDNTPYLNITLDFLQMASSVIQILDSFAQNSTECSEISPDCNASEFHGAYIKPPTLTQEHIFNITNTLHLDERNLIGYVILQVQNNNVVCLAETKIRSHDWILEFNFGIQKNLDDKVLLCDFESPDKNLDPICANCSNKKIISKISETNFNQFFDQFPFTWKKEIWVSSILTICIIGIISCICVFIFIIRRLRSKDVLEGNPCGTVLLVLSTIFTYLTVLPFCINLNETSDYSTWHCVTKLFCTTLSYSMIFSLILSRSIMILTCDYDGSFMSHINGYLQSSLCFFIVLVQACLIIQFSSINWLILDKDYCSKLASGNYFLVNMSYNVFLLCFLTCVTPFITRSKRNYKEGICFAIANLLFVVTWIIWCLLYGFLSENWRDFSVAFGLSTTASIIVICIFIPRTYLIMNGVVRDQITSALPSYNYSNTTNILDMKYRSTHALYDSVNIETAPSRGQVNMGYYYNSENSPTPSNFGDSKHDKGKDPELRICTLDNNYENFSHCDMNSAGTSKI